MVAARLNATHASPAAKFSIVGVLQEVAGRQFVRHVALLRESVDLKFGQADVPVWHMCPPLIAGPMSESAASASKFACDAHVIGSVPLSRDNEEAIITWLAEVDKEIRPGNPARQYIVHPPMKWEESEKNIPTYRRFSCVGFVVECYKAAGITLLNLDADDLPEVSMDLVACVYGNEIRERPSTRRHWGLAGEGPWRIFLAGYVIQAISRQDVEVRAQVYTPATLSECIFKTPPSGGSGTPG